MNRYDQGLGEEEFGNKFMGGFFTLLLGGMLSAVGWLALSETYGRKMRSYVRNKKPVKPKPLPKPKEN